MVGSLALLLLLSPTGPAVVAPNAATLAMSAASPTVSFTVAAYSVAPNAATLGLTATAPVVSFAPAGIVAPAAATLALNATSPTVTFTLAGYAIAPASATLGVNVGSVTISTNAPSYAIAPYGPTIGLSATQPVIDFDPADTFSPVTLNQAKAWLKIETDDDDALVGSLIVAAADYIELTTGIVCAPRTDVLTFACFDKRLPILRRPLRAVTAVAYTDSDGVDRALTSAAYKLKTRHGIMTLQAASGTTWPTAEADSVDVTADVGYLSNAEVPGNVRLAALEHIAQVYMNREGGTADLSGVDRLLAPYRAVVA